LSIARNTALNLAGHALPLVAALLLVPALAARLDPERFGFLALAWALVGYFSLFDLGLGRALSRLVAERRATPAQATLPELSRTAFSLTALLGIVAGAILFAAAAPICEQALRLSPGLRAEAEPALRVLAVSLPIVTLSATLRGLLEALHRFDFATAIRLPLGVLTFAAPLVVTGWSCSLVQMATALALVRVVAFVAYWAACKRLDAALVGFAWPRRSAARDMLGYGAWLTVSNIVGPLMVYADRFVIAGLVSVTAVAYYSAPYEVVTRLAVIPAAITGVLFPAMAAGTALRVAELLRSGFKATFIGVLPLAFAGLLLAPEWLTAWFGADYAREGFRAAQLLCLGAALNCLAHIPMTVLHARGHADVPAKLHLVELPVYLLLLFVLIPRWGIDGAALVWTLRCGLDVLVLFTLARRRMPQRRFGFTRAQLAVVGIVLAALAGALALSSPLQRLAYLIAGLLVTGTLAWLILLDAPERLRVRRPLALLSGNRLR